MNLLNNSKFSVMTAGNSTLSASNVDSTVYLDMQGFEGVLYVAMVLKCTAGASTTGIELIARHADSATSTAFTDLGSTSIAGSGTAASTGYIGKILAVDVHKPTKRYSSVSVDKDGAGKSQVTQVLAIQYGSRLKALTSTGYIQDGNSLTSPTT